MGKLSINPAVLQLPKAEFDKWWKERGFEKKGYKMEDYYPSKKFPPKTATK